MTKPRVDGIDVNIGSRLRAKRTELGITQQELAKILNISFQQVQKYEKGNNRISPKRLIEISKALKVPIQYFFHGLLVYPEEPLNKYSGLAEGASLLDDVGDPQVQSLIKNFYRISHPQIKKQLLEFVIVLSETFSF